MDDRRDRQLARLAIEQGYCTSQDIARARQEQDEARGRGQAMQIGQILLRNRCLNADQFVALMRRIDGQAAPAPEAGAGERTHISGPVAGDSFSLDADEVADPDAPPPRLGRYEILAEIGSGGMGTVYRARHVDLQMPVALKVLRLRGAGDGTLLERFRREAQVVARLRHPNIVGVTDFGQEGDWNYLVMELLEGRTLGDRLVQEGRLDAEAATRMIEDLARAVHYAHEEDVVHRDLKPANVFLPGEGPFKILDFGLARIIGDRVPSLTDSGIPMGTPQYMSPEQCRGDKRAIDGRTDVYSLGVMLYELLSGKLPHRADSLFELLRRIQKDDPPPPSSLGVEIDPRLESIALKAMAREREARYQTALDLAEALRRWRSGEPEPDLPAARAAPADGRKGCLGALLLMLPLVGR